MRKITQGEIQGQIEKGLFMRSTTIISHKRYMWEEEKKLGRMTGEKKILEEEELKHENDLLKPKKEFQKRVISKRESNWMGAKKC